MQNSPSASMTTLYFCGVCNRHGYDPATSAGQPLCHDCGLSLAAVNLYTDKAHPPQLPVELREFWLRRDARGELT